MLDLIETAAWTVSKTEAIHPASDFWWLDDQVTEGDRDWLHCHHREERLIQVSADHDPAALAVARSILAQSIGRGSVLGHRPGIKS